MSAHHVNGTECPLCSEKIETLDDRLKPWAKHFKEAFPDGHISWGFRNAEDQEKFFQEGKTRARFPHSKHNAMKDGKPCAQAFDIFRINPDGVPEWKTPYCEAVWARLKADSPEGLLEYAGEWEHFREMDHIQLKG